MRAPPASSATLPAVFLALAATAALAACGQGDDGGSDAPRDGTPGDGCTPVTPQAGVGEPAALAGITLAHNEVRARTSPCAPLPQLEWDASLAATAAAWVATCTDQAAPAGLIDHNPDRSAGHADYVGENVFGSSGGAAGAAQQAVASWAAEEAAYDYATNRCGGVCGHYTQLVWRATAKVGCAIGDCPGLAYRTTVVCDYGPGGNVGTERPY